MQVRKSAALASAALPDREPGRLAAEARAALAVARKDLRILRRYPLEALNAVVQPIYQFLIPSALLGATFLVGGRAIGLEASVGTPDVPGFLILGLIVAYLIGAAFWWIGFGLKREMDQGTLEPAWLSPTAREALALGSGLTAFTVAGIGTVVVLVLGATVFGVRFPASAVVTVPALLLAVVAAVGIGLFVAGFVLLAKEPVFFVDATNFLFSTFSGVAFPVTVLPGVLKLVALVLPTTYALDLLRSHTLGARPLFSLGFEYVALGVLSVLMLVLGARFFRWADDRVRRAGTLGQH